MLPSFTLPGRRLPRLRLPAPALLRVELLAGLVVALALIPRRSRSMHWRS